MAPQPQPALLPLTEPPPAYYPSLQPQQAQYSLTSLNGSPQGPQPQDCHLPAYTSETPPPMYKRKQRWLSWWGVIGMVAVACAVTFTVMKWNYII